MQAVRFFLMIRMNGLFSCDSRTQESFALSDSSYVRQHSDRMAHPRAYLQCMQHNQWKVFE
jgi:hypothetical protein